jgi:transmembrane sensor
MTAKQTIIDQAAHWHVASMRDDMDWDAFTRWLEETPEHRTRYDEIARADAMLQDNREALQTARASDRRPERSRRWGLWAGAGAAAAAVLALALNLPNVPKPATSHYVTGDTSRQIALKDGSSIELAPHSQIDIGDMAGQTTGQAMRLSGGAYFDIRHDPARTMTIAAGPLELRDIGTRFDVQTDGDSVRVAVAQGSVSVTAPELEHTVPVSGGHALVYDHASSHAQVEPLDQQAVGTWRHGQLFYDDTPLTLVAQDLERYGGIHVDLPPTCADGGFRGF